MAELNPSSIMQPRAHYSQGVVASNLIFVAGQTGVGGDPSQSMMGEGIDAQTRQTIANIEAVLADAGATLHDVVSTTVYLVDFALYAEFDRAYADCFGSTRPARATVRADLVHPSLLVEIQAVAVAGSGDSQ
jgi:2-iminobutanoate/2-iminopropanoate deaminase